METVPKYSVDCFLYRGDSKFYVNSFKNFVLEIQKSETREERNIGEISQSYFSSK